MTSKREKDTAPARREHDDELVLDRETIKDLEVDEPQQEMAKGGQLWCSKNSGCIRTSAPA